MKKVLAVMVGMFLLTVWPFSGVWIALLTPILGGGAEQTYLYPIYGGMILLAGIVVACTAYVLEEIRELKKDRDDK